MGTKNCLQSYPSGTPLFSLELQKDKRNEVKDSNRAIRFPKRKCAFICTTILTYTERLPHPERITGILLKALNSGAMFIVWVLGAVVRTK